MIGLRGWRGVLLALVWIAAGSGAALRAETLIARGSVWRYLDAGYDLGETWRHPEFAESWKEGRAPFGFGQTFREEGRTEIADQGWTCYLRRSFEVDADLFGRVRGLRLDVRRAAGAVVHLNGVEVWRFGMDFGPVNNHDRGRAVGSDQAYYRWYLPAHLVRQGRNVLAVELHHAANESVGQIFDLGLRAVTDEVDVWRGPYLQRCTPDGVTVRFRTSVPVTPILRYGTSPGRLDRELRGMRDYEHSLAPTGLAPATRYYYAVEVDGRTIAGGDAEHFFTTHPEPGRPRPFRIWVLGDSGGGRFSGAPIVRDAFLDYSAQPPDVWLMLGDNAYRSGMIEEHQEAIFDVYPEILRNSCLWPVIGNHDKRAFEGRERGTYFDVFTLPTLGEAGGWPSHTENYYSFDYGDVHFVALYSSDWGFEEDSPQIEWLNDDLARTRARWTIALIHIGPYSRGTYDSDEAERHIVIREIAVPILERYGVDLVLAGHSHLYQRSRFLRGHHGDSSTWDASRHVVQEGLGCPDDEHARECAGPPDSGYVGDGTVYVILGNSADLEEAEENQVRRAHPVVVVTEQESRGSLVIDVDADTIEARYLRDDGSVGDRFVIGERRAEAGGRAIFVAVTLGVALAGVGLGSWLRYRRARPAAPAGQG